MNPNSNQYLLGMAYVQKLQEELQPKALFSEYDDLTPDEPGRVWQLAKDLLNVAGETLASLRETTPHENDGGSLIEQRSLLE